MESSSSLFRPIAPGHRSSASDTQLFQKPSPGERTALQPPLGVDSNQFAWSTSGCQGYAPTTSSVSSGLTGFGLQDVPSPGTVQAVASGMAESLDGELATQTSNKPRKPRRPKPRIELAPDQPPTTQGKPRARVYVACLQCRTRKIRCDGAKPTCHNCNRRANSQCEYDPLPKRRGPDKTPGARQRIIRELQDQPDGDGQSRKRRRTQEVGDKHGAEDGSSSPTDSHIQQSSILQQEPNKGSVAAFTSGYHDMTLVLATDASYPTGKPIISQNIYQNAITYSNMGNGYLIGMDDEKDENQQNDTTIDTGPSLSFARKVWWDSLLCLYLSPAATRHHHLTPTERDMASRSIISDLKFVFHESNYWFSFFHIPTFFGTFCDPMRRENMQPCLVLALLAMAAFWHSSEIERGESGRTRALRFRDEAQAALEASINSRWLDETVVQAAWVLAMFEICAHPKHSAARAMSALALLDSLIHSLSLTLLDADDADASVFSPRSVPTVPQKASWVYGAYQDPSGISDGSTGYVSSTPTPNVGCGCKALTLASNWTLTNEHTPLWGPTPAWNATWSLGEIRKESCRRLCWSSMTLAAGHVSYLSAARVKLPELFISNPANYALLFSGESMARSPIPSFQSSKDTIWALYDRSYLLWHGCARMRNDAAIPDTEKTQFAIKAWLETDVLEEALNKHTCNIERAFLFLAREYIFNIRMCISYEYQRWIPLVTANVDGLFHRRKAEEWLTHQASVARRLMDGLHIVTGNSNNILARRPFFVFWFMGQMHRALCLWEYDQTLMTALDVCKALMTASDYLSSLWPCPEQRIRYGRLRQRVENACRIAGVAPPQPFNVVPLLPRSSQRLGQLDL